MVRDVKSKIQDTDRFIIQREDDELKTVDGSDLAEFVEDLQSRFTDEIEETVTNVEQLVTNNAITIGENKAENDEEHEQLRQDIAKNDQGIGANRAQNHVQDNQLDSLERNSRSFGYYAFGGTQAFDATGVLNPGFFVAYDAGDNILTDTFVGTKKLSFHKHNIHLSHPHVLSRDHPNYETYYQMYDIVFHWI